MKSKILLLILSVVLISCETEDVNQYTTGYHEHIPTIEPIKEGLIGYYKSIDNSSAVTSIGITDTSIIVNYSQSQISYIIADSYGAYYPCEGTLDYVVMLDYYNNYRDIKIEYYFNDIIYLKQTYRTEDNKFVTNTVAKLQKYIEPVNIPEIN